MEFFKALFVHRKPQQQQQEQKQPPKPVKSNPSLPGKVPPKSSPSASVPKQEKSTLVRQEVSCHNSDHKMDPFKKPRKRQEKVVKRRKSRQKAMSSTSSTGTEERDEKPAISKILEKKTSDGRPKILKKELGRSTNAVNEMEMKEPWEEEADRRAKEKQEEAAERREKEAREEKIVGSVYVINTTPVEWNKPTVMADEQSLYPYRIPGDNATKSIEKSKPPLLGREYTREWERRNNPSCTIDESEDDVKFMAEQEKEIKRYKEARAAERRKEEEEAKSKEANFKDAPSVGRELKKAKFPKKKKFTNTEDATTDFEEIATPSRPAVAVGKKDKMSAAARLVEDRAKLGRLEGKSASASSSDNIQEKS